jgi:hypothetical protein
MLEQVFIAALDVGERKIADFCLVQIAKRFTTSSMHLSLQNAKQYTNSLI